MSTATEIYLEKLSGPEFSAEVIAVEMNRRNGKPDDYPYAMFPPRAHLAITLAKLILAKKIPIEFRIKSVSVQGNMAYRVHNPKEEYVCTIYSDGMVTFTRQS